MIGIMIDFNQSNTPKYKQLYEHLKREIEMGNLKNNEKLPSVRLLSQTLKISKATIENAYNQLLLEGYIESRNKSGYYVIDFEKNELESLRHNVIRATPAKAKKQVLRRYNSDGTEESAFSFIEWKKALNRVLEYEKQTLLSYGDVKDELELRDEIARFVRQSRGVVCKSEQIVIGAGIQYLFGVIAAAFRTIENRIAFEYPGFSKGMYIFEDYGYQMKKIPLQDDGIDIKLLEHSKSNLVYVSPSHQYPTGSVMGIKKRLQLLDWAYKNNGYIIEDDYDSLLRYEGIPVPALQGLRGGEHVIYVGSFSKLLIPALRISFMIVPESLLQIFDLLLPRYSQSVSKIEQLALANFMSEGAFERHIRRIRKIYGKKNQILIEAFKVCEYKEVTLIGKGSGLHVTLSLNKGVDVNALIDACVAIGISLEAIAGYKEGNIVVFSYSGVPDDDMFQVVKTIGEFAHKMKIGDFRK
ncbi:MocR-like pyridoxine biosynthesis transcription factor PdxR [Fusibacter bizertensis]